MYTVYAHTHTMLLCFIFLYSILFVDLVYFRMCAAVKLNFTGDEALSI